MNPLFNPIFLARIAKSYLFDVDRLKRSGKEEIRKYQDRCVRRVIKYAFNVPIYHRKYKKAGIYPDDIRGVKDIERLPFITKKDFRNKDPYLLLPLGSKVEKYHRVSTSGSTGEPVTLYCDSYSIFRTFIGFIRMIKEHNISWRKTRMAIIADLSRGSVEEAYFSRVALPSLRSLFPLENLKAFHVGEKPEFLIKKLESFDPEFLGGYPGVIKILSILKKQGFGKDLNPRIIATSGAIVDDYTRRYIEKAFKAKLFDVYSATECNPMAFQCKNGHYHIHSDFVYMEFMSPKEKESISGDGGNVIITRLFGGGTPVVRYTGISDFVVPSQEESECEISSPIIQEIGGRRVDSIVLPNGRMIPPLSFTGIPYKVMQDFNTDKIQQFQIIQQSLKEIDILLVIDKNLRNVGPSVDKIFKEIKKRYKQKIGNSVEINVKEVDRINTVRPGSVTPPPVVISKVSQDQYER
jgi:phenylacetate-CoA ligase